VLEQEEFSLCVSVTQDPVVSGLMKLSGRMCSNHLCQPSGVPIEIVRKVILRHAKLSTTDRYLVKFSDVEAMKWIDNLYG